MSRLRPSGFGAPSPLRPGLLTWGLGLAVSLACFGATGPLVAQQPAPQPTTAQQPQDPPMPTPLFRAVANVVRVDALVTEEKGGCPDEKSRE